MGRGACLHDERQVTFASYDDHKLCHEVVVVLVDLIVEVHTVRGSNVRYVRSMSFDRSAFDIR